MSHSKKDRRTPKLWLELSSKIYPYLEDGKTKPQTHENTTQFFWGTKKFVKKMQLKGSSTIPYMLFA